MQGGLRLRGRGGSYCLGFLDREACRMVNDINPAVPIIRSIP